MRVRLVPVAVGLAAALLGAVPAVPVLPVARAYAADAPAPAKPSHPSLVGCSAGSSTGDARLGPEHLPVLGPVGIELWGYQRTGGLSAAQFLQTWYDSDESAWRYPPVDGFRLDAAGEPMKQHLTLPVGWLTDRYGSESGALLAPAGAPYAARSIPPTYLNDATDPASCNYHAYRVRRPLTVDAGLVAGWFSQPGGGLQYQLESALVPGAPNPLDVRWLIDNGYLTRLR
jgi:Tuberculosis necrotizing toxin